MIRGDCAERHNFSTCLADNAVRRRFEGYNRRRYFPAPITSSRWCCPLLSLRSRLFAVCRLACYGLAISFTVAASAQDAVQPIEFRRDVLPILSENCFACHGFDEKARQAGLRLDTFAGATDIADSGVSAVVPGNPDESELLARIASSDPDVRMPPAETEKSLSAEQQRILRQWIEQGGEFQKHWSFERPRTESPPAIPNAALTHPIDRFIQARLNEAGVPASPRASPETLLRRVSLDLIGLPPSLDEIDEFVREFRRDPDGAYAKVVDRLLKSPHYGERWGRWWLDQARYADSNGYSIDAPRQIWKFRDWVIDALNDDMPFDQFTVEQIAGDLLRDATQEQKIATGFHRNTQINQEGGIDKEQFRVDSVFDRVATTGTVWLGLTIGCAQCHDHKFDPIEQKEYYQLFAFFNNQDEPTLKVYSDAESVPELKVELNAAEKELDQYIVSRSDAYDEWESRLTDDERQKMSRSQQEILALAPEKRSAKQKRQVFAIEVGKVDSRFQTLYGRVSKLHGQVRGVATTLVMQERHVPRKTSMLIKGDFTRPAEEVPA